MKTIAILVIAVFGLAYGRFLLDDEALMLSSMEDDYQEKRKLLRVEVDESVNDFYDAMPSTRNKWAILTFDDDKKVAIETSGESDDTTTKEEDKVEFEKMKNAIPTGESRYILYKFSFYSEVRQKHVNKIVFIFWDNFDFTQHNRFIRDVKQVKENIDSQLFLAKFSSAKYFTYEKMAGRVQWLV
ncbi:uncharacterized protein LOC116295248 [Actinia tenebrosa]|uniref:Uncharacterized protein LOC116295248 n=1 Tax=Actinia tenebrosa TaxID=6105 RepID=A0A6P8I1Z7_ACTTE|nr:uncharacterized protein LOC116295248 [Actinia tenebrosa]